MLIAIAQTKEEILACFPVMAELRPHLVLENFYAQIRRQQQEGYQLIYIKSENTVQSVAGFRLGEYLAWGKILYIDDLATLSAARGKGHARHLLDWLKSYAKAHQCNEIHLDSGYQRHAAHRLYLNYGFALSSHHLALKLNAS